jgi:hypothetical protein
VASDDNVLAFVKTGLVARDREEERSEDQMLNEVVDALLEGQDVETAAEGVGMRIVQWKERDEDSEDEEEEEDENEGDGVEEEGAAEVEEQTVTEGAGLG